MAAGKTAERLLFDLVHDIAADGLRPGDRLPPQPELMRRHGVGPTPLREALRMLELAGLVSVRPGPNAGTIIETANAGHLAALVAPFLCMAGVTYGQLMDAWAATEPLLAAAAAANPDREAVAAEIAAFLAHSAPGRIAASLPPGARFTGGVNAPADPAAAEAGIIELPGGRRYAVAVFVAGPPIAPKRRDALVTGAAKAVLAGLR
jgi:DNA-binding transcriptional MocR family regulator